MLLVLLVLVVLVLHAGRRGHGRGVVRRVRRPLRPAVTQRRRGHGVVGAAGLEVAAVVHHAAAAYSSASSAPSTTKAAVLRRGRWYTHTRTHAHTRAHTRTHTQDQSGRVTRQNDGLEMLFLANFVPSRYV